MIKSNGGGGGTLSNDNAEVIIKVFCPNCGTIKITLKSSVEQGGVKQSGYATNDAVDGRCPVIDCVICGRIFRKSDLKYDFEYKDNW